MNVRRAVCAMAVCLALAGCGDGPGTEVAWAACDAYASTGPQGGSAREPAQEQLRRAVADSDAWKPLESDMRDAWEQADAMAADQNAGRPVTSEQLDGHAAADERVRADCADAGHDIGRPHP